jgi:hypothetical protein
MKTGGQSLFIPPMTSKVGPNTKHTRFTHNFPVRTEIDKTYCTFQKIEYNVKTDYGCYDVGPIIE